MSEQSREELTRLVEYARGADIAGDPLVRDLTDAVEQLMAQAVGFVVLAERPDRNSDAPRYEPAGGVWSEIDPVLNHQAFCEMTAEANPDRYRDVRYVVGEIRLTDQQDGRSEGSE